jgi:hypothetical protein
MKKHTWYKEIVAWAEGKEIEQRRFIEGKWTKWEICKPTPIFYPVGIQFRIKSEDKK